MPLPFFYIPSPIELEEAIQLDEETSRHISGVLRMKKGETLQLTDGKGYLAIAEIVDDHKKKCIVRIQKANTQQRRSRCITIAISLTKNSNRFEWFLEKATEIGINEIIPMICERTEKEKFRMDRMQNILVSAMLQSQQTWLPVLSHPVSFTDIIQTSSHQKKFIAHCMDNEKSKLQDLTNADQTKIILIGPEGDFTPSEINSAIQHLFLAVTLGESRLRTETAGVVAATLLQLS